MKRYREWNPRQNLLLPPRALPAQAQAGAPLLLDWLPKDHAVYFLLDVVEQLDLSAIEDALAKRRTIVERAHSRLG